MQYRKFGKSGWEVSALGFGCMRLPVTDGNPGSANIDEGESIRMIRYAIDHGVNYVDTAYPYHGGQSEVVTGKALKDGYREKVRLATKSPVWLVKKPEDFDTLLDEQLRRLQTDHIDYYLLHSLNKDEWENSVLKHGLIERAEKERSKGKIRYIGFSFHDKFDVFKQIVDGYDKWDFCQIQYNYMDTENQAGTKGLRFAASKGLPVIVMEPILGGRLANPPKSVRDVFDSFEVKRSPSEWALQWIWDHPEVTMVLSGMSTMSQVEENVRSADTSRAQSFGEVEHSIIAQARKKFEERTAVECNKCGYCMPCPHGVNIPGNFELYNDGYMYDDPKSARFRYARFMDEKERANMCDKCKECESKCPQGLVVSELMPKVHAVLGEGKSY